MGNGVGQRAFQNARIQKRQKAEVTPLLERALYLHKAGLLTEAQAAYRQLLELAPDQFVALHLLGVLESQAKNLSASRNSTKPSGCRGSAVS
ncbi:Flp pilus assembly protein TadD [Bradyrhizobium sp. LM6.11]